ncbi:hypothetical protein D1007_34261 [Hordeum vulgare]|nr:hypothetical protein D1007_34261 [Hordeum vulgare]
MDQELQVSKIPLKHKGKMKVQVDTSNLRRSLRSNKYDGFKIPSMAEGKITKSKVKPRMIPNIALQEVDRAPTLEVPPPTAINTMQAIATQLCVIPEEELADSELLREDPRPADGQV